MLPTLLHVHYFYAMDNSQQNADKLAAALAAVDLVQDGQMVGLGTGSTAAFAIKALGERVQNGLQITATSSSVQSEQLARSLHIPVVSLGELSEIDISIDGADEFTTSLTLIKGGGGALFREKIMASMSKFSIIITDTSKKVELLGAFKLPVEVVPLAFPYVSKQLGQMGGIPNLRKSDGKTFITDNGNYILDTNFGLIAEPEQLSAALNQIDGLYAHGLFIGLASQIIMSDHGKLIVFEGK